MKFAVALTLATTAMAGIVVRDDKIVKEVIATAGSDIDALSTAVAGYNGDKTALVKASDQLISDLKSGTSAVSGGPSLTAEESIGLASGVGTLTKKGTALTEALKGRKDEVQKAGECKLVQTQIAAISSNSKSLIDAVVQKVPEAAQSIAKDLAGKLLTVLADAESAYKECTDASGGASSSAAPTGASSSAAPTDASSSAAPTGASSSAAPTASSSAKPTGSATPSPTGGASTSAKPTGTGVPTKSTSVPTVPTGAAGAFAPAGALAVAVAVLAL